MTSVSVQKIIIALDKTFYSYSNEFVQSVIIDFHTSVNRIILLVFQRLHKNFLKIHNSQGEASHSSNTIRVGSHS